jgi:polyferredoxin
MSDTHPTSTTQAKYEPNTYSISPISHRIRMAVQLLTFILFLYLLLGTRQEIRILLPHDLFLLVNPLVGIGAMVASRSWISPMIIGASTLLIISLVFGRAWCSWLCPMGTLIDWMPSRRISKKNLDIPRLWRQGKNLTLLIVIFSALLGSLTLIILDPITLLFRSLAAAVLPLLNSLLLVVDKWLYNIESIQPGVAWFDTSVRIHILGGTGFYLPNLTLLILFIGVLALNAVRPRAWCRYLCPLGGLLGLVSKISLVRYQIDAGKCISCDRCAVSCPTGAIDPLRNYTADSVECITCLDCVGNCPTHAISFPAKVKISKEYQPEKRHFIFSLGLAAVGAFALRFIPSPNRTVPKLIRPPSATEESLAEKCIRCGECIKICPTAAIQPANSASAWESTWSPHLQLRHGYCDYSCNACGQACPTGAIAKMSLDEKRKQVIGVAVIDKKRCIPFTEKKECIVCEEMCPLPQKAIRLKSGEGSAAQPYVDEDLCIGCGICEHQCPLNGDSAIRIFRSLAVAPPPEPEIY